MASRGFVGREARSLDELVICGLGNGKQAAHAIGNPELSSKVCLRFVGQLPNINAFEIRKNRHVTLPG